jgi:peptide chain release factor 3
MSWPVGMGGQFEGIYDLARDRLYRPSGDSNGYEGDATSVAGLGDRELNDLLSEQGLAQLREEAELAQAAMAFDETAYRAMAISPRSISGRRSRISGSSS